MGDVGLRNRVLRGVLMMAEGERTTVGKVAAVEGVSKSPQLYRYFAEFVNEGLLTVKVIEHYNRHAMFEFTRTSKWANGGAPTIESDGR